MSADLGSGRSKLSASEENRGSSEATLEENVFEKIVDQNDDEEKQEAASSSEKIVSIVPVEFPEVTSENIFSARLDGSGSVQTESSFALETSQEDVAVSQAKTSQMATTKSVIFADTTKEEEISTGSDEELQEETRAVSDFALYEELSVNTMPSDSINISFTSMLEEVKASKKANSDDELLNEVLESIKSGIIIGEPKIESVDESKASSPTTSDDALDQLIQKSKSRLGLLPVIEEEEEDELEIDRNIYFEMHALYMGKLNAEKHKNMFLQKAMSSYYLHRRMFHVLKEPGPTLKEAVEKYDGDLDALEQLYEESERQKTQALDDEKRMTLKCAEKREELKTNFDKLEQTEMDYVKGLNVDDPTKKHLDRLIKRHRVVTKVLMESRMAHIQLKNKVQQKSRALQQLDHLGEGFHIMDYVQLKNENQKLKDRLEDKIQELVRLRTNCQHHTQILAHNREKDNVLDLDMANARDELGELEREIYEARQQLAFLKGDLETMRRDLTKLKEENGLLIFPKLLRHMEKAIDNVGDLQLESEKVQVECVEKAQKVRTVRRNLEDIARNKKKEAAKKLGRSSMDWSSTSVNVREVKKADSSVLVSSPIPSWAPTFTRSYTRSYTRSWGTSYSDNASISPAMSLTISHISQ